MNFENVSFSGHLSDERQNDDLQLAKLRDLKRTIDLRLQELEARMKANAYVMQIAINEKETKHIKTGVYFSPFHHLL